MSEQKRKKYGKKWNWKEKNTKEMGHNALAPKKQNNQLTRQPNILQDIKRRV
jgi:hypothetical protein